MTEVLAAGAVLWRAANHGVEIALVHRPRYDDWSLPKGKLEPGESVYSAAVREVAEETGNHCFLGHHLGQQRYPVTNPRPATKVVDYFAARIARPGPFQPNKEVDALRWVTVDTAFDLLTYPRDHTVLRAFAALPADLTTVLLVRHAIAGDRAHWQGPDDLRPLTPAGLAQTQALLRLLPLFGTNQIHSAPLVRCIQTVEPLARHLNAPITPEPLLSESGYLLHEPAARTRLRAIAATGHTPIVCSQGGVIPDLISRLAKESGLTLPHTHAPKASTWLLCFTKSPHPQLLATHHIPAP